MEKVVKATLNDVYVKRFEEVKTDLGLVFNANVLRVLIFERWQKIQGKIK